MQELALNNTSAAPVLPEVETAKVRTSQVCYSEHVAGRRGGIALPEAVPELPEPSALPQEATGQLATAFAGCVALAQDTSLSLSPEGPGPSLRGAFGA